jgi:hypothetical protein
LLASKSSWQHLRLDVRVGLGHQKCFASRRGRSGRRAPAAPDLARPLALLVLELAVALVLELLELGGEVVAGVRVLPGVPQDAVVELAVRAHEVLLHRPVRLRGVKLDRPAHELLDVVEVGAEAEPVVDLAQAPGDALDVVGDLDAGAADLADGPDRRVGSM